jgi:methionyl-tRNA formyltransferase
LQADAAGIRVACGTGILNITRLQQAGRKVVAAADFIKSHALTGVRLGVTTGSPS